MDENFVKVALKRDLVRTHAIVKTLIAVLNDKSNEHTAYLLEDVKMAISNAYDFINGREPYGTRYEEVKQ